MQYGKAQAGLSTAAPEPEPGSGQTGEEADARLQPVQGGTIGSAGSARQFVEKFSASLKQGVSTLGAFCLPDDFSSGAENREEKELKQERSDAASDAPKLVVCLHMHLNLAVDILWLTH